MHQPPLNTAKLPELPVCLPSPDATGSSEYHSDYHQVTNPTWLQTKTLPGTPRGHAQTGTEPCNTSSTQRSIQLVLQSPGLISKSQITKNGGLPSISASWLRAPTMSRTCYAGPMWQPAASARLMAVSSVTPPLRPLLVPKMKPNVLLLGQLLTIP